MGASKERQKRRAEREAGELPSKIQLRENQRKKRIRKRILTISLCVVIVLVLVGVVVYASGVLNNFIPAVTVGDQNVSVLEYNYHFQTTYNNYLSQMQSMGMLDYIGIDFNTSLAKQQYDETMTWDEYFKQQTDASLLNILALYQEALKAGYSFNDTDRETIDTAIADIESTAKQYGYTTTAYLSRIYGSGMSMGTLRSAMERTTVASRFYQDKYASFTYTLDEAQAYFDEHRENFEYVDYRSFTFSGAAASSDSTTTPTDEEKAAAKAAAKEKADAMLAAITDEQSFMDLAFENTPEDQKENYNSDTATKRAATLVSSMTEVNKAYLGDAARVAGDKGIIEDGDNYVVVMFLSRYKYDYNTINARHILVPFEGMTEDQTTPTDEQKAAAKSKAEEYLAMYEAGEHTADAFGALANEYSTDTGSNTVGGLYENVYKGRMMEAFDAWIFDESRTEGDTGIVETTYGYHVMYWQGLGRVKWYDDVYRTMASEAYNAYCDEVEALYPFAQKFGYGMAGDRK